MKNKNWENKKVCITGGSHGIGFELVKLFLSKDSIVYNMSRSIPPIKNEKLINLQADLYENIPQINEDLDLVIMNVGVNPGNKNFDDYTEDEIDRGIFMNLNIHVKLAKRLKYKKIVFVNSILSFTGLPQNSIYCASKAFISSFNDSLRREGKDSYIVYSYKVNTTLFKDIKDFMTIDKVHLANRIITDIENNVKTRTLPFYFYLINFIEAFCPTFISDFIAKMAILFFTKHKND